MPLYDCMLLLKPHVGKDSLMELVSRVGKHVFRRNGVLTDVKSLGNVQLGYGIKKLDGRYYQIQSIGVTQPVLADCQYKSLETVFLLINIDYVYR
ncbi:MATH and LRR domain-containing protein [Tanacetum coccineum]